MGRTEMFKGASPLIFARAAALRERMTQAEELLWEELRNKKTGFKFRRQHPLGPYIADFYCHQLKLVIELDGNIHLRPDVQQYDKQREADLIFMKLHIVRFQNSEVIDDVHQVLQQIHKTAESIIKNQVL